MQACLADLSSVQPSQVMPWVKIWAKQAVSGLAVHTVCRWGKRSLARCNARPLVQTHFESTSAVIFTSRREHRQLCITSA
eukprot:6205439-Pleurochrysis_carterae.AAC.1